jgi:hypothetical protein
MKITKEIFLIILLCAVLVIITFFVLQRSTQSTSSDTPYSTYSGSLNGVKPLYDTLKKLNFRVERVRAEPYTLSPNLSVLFLVQPHDVLKAETRVEMQAFVEQGGILVVATTQNLHGLVSDYGLQIVEAEKPLITSLRLSPNPFFEDTPVDHFISFTACGIHPVERELAPLFGVGTEYSLVTFRVGAGRVFVLSCPYIFTKHGLGFEENATLVYNLLTYLPPKSRIGFDEYHHGFRSQTESRSRSGTGQLVRLFWGVPIGWALVYAGMLILIFLLLRGRRFGQPIEPDRSRRRLSSEYVLAMENLYRKGRKRDAILEHIRNEFRRTLAAPWNITPTLDIPTFVDEIAKRKPIDADELRSLLEALEQTIELSEHRLLTLAQRVEAFQDHIQGK